MKNCLIIFVLASAVFWGCSEQKSTSIADIEGEIIWQDGEKIIKNVLDSIPKVVIIGIPRDGKYQLNYSLIDENETEIVLSGSIRVFGDLNNDQIPEFYHEDITETTDSLFGWRHIIRITKGQKLRVLDGVYSSLSKKTCNKKIGAEEFFEFDNKGKEPHMVLNGSYGYLNNESDCNSFQNASSQIHYAFVGNNNYLTREANCPIKDEKIDLAALYQQNKYALRDLKALSNNYYSVYEYGEKFRACGDDGRDGISHLELIAGVTIKNGSSNKRTDIMPYVEDEFTNINPAFVTWAKDNLIPIPTDSQINGLTYEFLYQYGYKQQLRKFALLKLIIMQQGQELMMKEYSDATSTMEYIVEEERVVQRDNFNTYDFLERKREWASQEFRNMDYETKYLENTDYGFLIRRMLDGSEPAIWEAMQKIFLLYDNTWYERTFLNQKWKGVELIDSVTYYNKRILSGIDSIIYSKDSIPEGIAVENGAGITINCTNGKEVTFTNNNSDGESYDNYTLKGYWPKEGKILIRYMGWEVGSTLLVDVNTGKDEYRNWELYPSEDAQNMAETIDEMGYQAILLLKKEESKWVEMNEYGGHSMTDGFWIEDTFFFKENNQYYTIGELAL